MCAAADGSALHFGCFWDPELGVHIGTLTHEAARLSRLHVYHGCLATAVGVMLMT